MKRDEADDLLAMAVELEARAFTHEKRVEHLDLTRARELRSLANRIRAVVATSGGAGDRDAVHSNVVGLRLEAMVSLIDGPLIAPDPNDRPGDSAPIPVAIGRLRRRKTS